MIEIINIKEDNPSVDVALYRIYEKILDLKAMGNKVLVVIHGYGSSGRKSEIKKAIPFYLADLKNKKIIKDFVLGENWTSNNEVVAKIIEISPDILVKQNVSNINSGLSVILIS